jgi:molecular chaperone GrpE (heat shock protein)
MANWFKSLFGKGRDTGHTNQLEREIQSLRVMLQDQDRVVENLRKELQQHRREAELLVKRSTQTVIENFMADVAPSVTKLNSQIYIVEEQNRPLNVRDVLAVGKNILGVFQKYGLRLEGVVGELTSFDPDHHASLKKDVPFTQEEPVVVRFVGVAYRGKLLSRARVEGSGSKQRTINIHEKDLRQNTTLR